MPILLGAREKERASYEPRDKALEEEKRSDGGAVFFIRGWRGGGFGYLAVSPPRPLRQRPHQRRLLCLNLSLRYTLFSRFFNEGSAQYLGCHNLPAFTFSVALSRSHRRPGAGLPGPPLGATYSFLFPVFNVSFDVSLRMAPSVGQVHFAVTLFYAPPQPRLHVCLSLPTLYYTHLPSFANFPPRGVRRSSLYLYNHPPLATSCCFSFGF